MSIGLNQPNIDSLKTDKVIRLAEEIFRAFPRVMCIDNLF